MGGRAGGTRRSGSDSAVQGRASRAAAASCAAARRSASAAARLCGARGWRPRPAESLLFSGTGSHMHTAALCIKTVASTSGEQPLLCLHPLC